MTILVEITPPVGGINAPKLHLDLAAIYPDVVGISDNRYVVLEDGSTVTQQQLQAVVDLHNAASLTTEQQEAAQADSAKTALRTLMTGLHGLSAEDKSYAIACRIMASKDGATQQTIMGIVDRPTAVAYITSKPEWTGATAATRNLVGDVLEMVAGITQVLLLVL